MRVQHSAWVFDKALNKQTCDELIRIGEEQIIEDATVDGGKQPAKKTRICKTGWIYDPYIMDRIMEYVSTANVNAGWNFDYDIPQAIQFTKYEVGNHYNWHRDTNTDISKTGGATRKISITINLNDDYEGGDLEIDSEDHYWTKNPRKVRSGLGNIAVFPSDTYHRVTKVTKGTRYSLVVWVMGEPWR